MVRRARVLTLFSAIGPFIAIGLSACSSLGPRALRADQVDYARALSTAKNREILSIIVGLRYGDSPAFLNLSQIIAAYTFDAMSTAQANTQPDPGGPRFGATGTLSYSNHPTFTFTPTTGEAYAQAYIRPLPPALILPLADSGIPVDLLFRITVQSVGGLRNAAMLGGAGGNGSPGFFELLRVLRRLQLDGLLSIQYKPGADSGQVSLSLGVPQGAEASREEADIARLRSLLQLPAQSTPYPIVSGNGATRAGTIGVQTRSALAILSDLGAEIEVPAADVRQGATKESIALVGGETRPVAIVRVGKKAPANAFCEVRYRSSSFWIDDDDFDSKYALTVVQNVMALAEVTDTSHAPIVTVPAN